MGYGQSHTAQLSFREALSNFGPVITTVHSHVQAGTLTTRFKEPGPALVFPHGHKQLQWIVWIHDHISHAGNLIYKEDLFPALSTIGGSVHPSFRVRSPGASDGPCINHIGIAGLQHSIR